MRVFVSVDLPSEIEDKIKEIQRRIKELGLIEAKFVKKGLFHLTLKFLGEIDEEKVEEVRKKLREIKLKSFETKISELGVFSEKFIRIVWLHLSNCDELQREVGEKLKSLFESERRFMSHLTIARVKNIKDKQRFLNELKKVQIPEIKFQVNDFKLKKSTLTEKGPVYETLEEYPLS